MDNQGNFRQQSLTNMQRAVCSGELTITDYYERQQELRMAESSGIDDQSSCTKGKAPLSINADFLVNLLFFCSHIIAFFLSGVIQRIYSLSSMSRNVVRTYVCSRVDHYASTYGDKGWGCGYR